MNNHASAAEREEWNLERMPDGATPKSELTGVKNWDDSKQRWIGVVVQIIERADGQECLLVYDVMSAETQVEIDDKLREAIFLKPWESSPSSVG